MAILIKTNLEAFGVSSKSLEQIRKEIALKKEREEMQDMLSRHREFSKWCNDNLSNEDVKKYMGIPLYLEYYAWDLSEQVRELAKNFKEDKFRELSRKFRLAKEEHYTEHGRGGLTKDMRDDLKSNSVFYKDDEWRRWQAYNSIDLRHYAKYKEKREWLNELRIKSHYAWLVIKLIERITDESYKLLSEKSGIAIKPALNLQMEWLKGYLEIFTIGEHDTLTMEDEIIMGQLRNNVQRLVDIRL